MIPLFAFVAGDTVGVLILARPEDTIESVAAVVQAAASVRVAPRARVSVMAGTATLESCSTVAGSGLQAFDRLDVLPGPEGP